MLSRRGAGGMRYRVTVESWNRLERTDKEGVFWGLVMAFILVCFFTAGFFYGGVGVVVVFLSLVGLFVASLVSFIFWGLLIRPFISVEREPIEDKE